MADDQTSSTATKSKPASQVYEGGCHCGKTSFTVKLSPPLTQMPVTSCDCSICHTNGALMVYPLESQFDWHSGKDELVPYTFGPARIVHHFCGTCGTSVSGKSNEKGFFENNRALNVRTLRGVDLDKLTIRKVSQRGPMNKEFEYDESKYPSNPYGSRIL